MTCSRIAHDDGEMPYVEDYEDEEEEESETETPIEAAMIAVAEKLLKPYVNGKTVETAIEKAIERTVYREVAKRLEDNFESLSAKFVTDAAKKAFEEMTSGPVVVDDGWHPKKQYTSFEELVKSKVRESVSKEWDLKRQFERAVQDRIDKVLGDIVKETSGVFAEYVLERMVKKEGEKKE